jgi:Mrp family chromosome partitioning ATPase
MTDPQSKTIALSSQKHRRREDATLDLVTVYDPTSAASDAYRMLRTNLFYALIDSPPKIIVLTSVSFGEGKSTTAANLAVTLAQADKNVLILDCDLRRPRLHSMFDVSNTSGLVDILAGGSRMEEVWR